MYCFLTAAEQTLVHKYESDHSFFYMWMCTKCAQNDMDESTLL